LKKCYDKILKSKLAINLAEVYIQKIDYKKALTFLNFSNPYDKISTFNNLFSLSKKIKLEYYLKLIFLNLRLNNIIDAQIALENGQVFIEKFLVDKEFSFEIAYTLSLLEYSKGNYSKASELIIFAIDLADDKNVEQIRELVELKNKIRAKV